MVAEVRGWTVINECCHGDGEAGKGLMYKNKSSVDPRGSSRYLCVCQRVSVCV